MTVEELIGKYYTEADCGLRNNKAPSELNRGEGTEAQYFIFKIDLCDSTRCLFRKKSETYLKIAHVFLSTIHDITRHFGSDSRHVEYQGDSVIAYFPENQGMALNVLKASYLSRYAASKMQGLDRSFEKYAFKTRVVLHYGTLIVAKIGPWGDNDLMTMGIPIHHAAKMEDKVKSGEGIATKAFGEKLLVRERRLYLSPNYGETTQPAFVPPASKPLGLANDLKQPAYENNTLANMLSPLGNVLSEMNLGQSSLSTQVQDNREVINYNIKWDQIRSIL